VPPRETAGFAVLLERSLDAIAREAPGAYARVADATGADGVLLAVDAAPFVVRFDASPRTSHRLTSGAAAVDVRTDRDTILALLEGTLALVDALECERLWIQGRTDAVLRFDAALLAFLDGAVRAPSVLPLLDAFRDDGRPRCEE
jgi:hypothetical protein